MFIKANKSYSKRWRKSSFHWYCKFIEYKQYKEVDTSSTDYNKHIYDLRHRLVEVIWDDLKNKLAWYTLKLYETIIQKFKELDTDHKIYMILDFHKVRGRLTECSSLDERSLHTVQMSQTN